MLATHTPRCGLVTGPRHRCPNRQLAPLWHAERLFLQAPAPTPASAPVYTVLSSLHCTQRGSFTCRTFNGLTAGLNESVDEGDHVQELDPTIKARCQRFVANLYDWGVRSTDKKDTLNTREQAPLTWLDKASLVLVRLLQTVIMAALAWHVASWLVTSARAQVMRYSLSWPAWLPW